MLALPLLLLLLLLLLLCILRVFCRGRPGGYL
jgi:hypothetical protein